MPPIDPFLAEITRLALAVIRGHGFALGGGNALVLHGLFDRPTFDVDLFCDQESGVRDAADLVREALDAAGLTAVEVGDDSDLDDVIYDLADHMDGEGWATTIW
jgi:hypothetical protein